MTRASQTQSPISLLALLASAGFAAWGLSQLAMGLNAPAIEPVPIAPPAQAATAPTGPAAIPVSMPPWPALFGQPAPAPEPPAPAPEPVIDENPFPDDDPYFDTVPYTLRGLVYQGDGLGFALLEADDGIIVVRQGDSLPGGETVLEVARDGIEIGFDDDILFLGFEDSTDDTAGDYNSEFGDDPAMIQELQGTGNSTYGFGLNPFGLGAVGQQSQ